MNIGLALIVAGLIGRRIVANARVRDFYYKMGVSTK